MLHGDMESACWVTWSLQSHEAPQIKDTQTSLHLNTGKPVNTLFVAKKMDLAREMYFAILLDRQSAQVMMIGCGEGQAPVSKQAPGHDGWGVVNPVDSLSSTALHAMEHVWAGSQRHCGC